MDRALDPAYLRDQYGTTHKLDARIEAHQRYSERPDDYLDWILDRLDPQPGDLAVDVGCGRGSYHPRLVARGVRAILGIDASSAMVASTQREANELRELRRVLKPSGRVVLSTNAEDHSARLLALHRVAAQKLDYTPVNRVTDRFNLGHLALVEEVFPTAECFLRQDAFIFPSTEAALSYYASGMIDAIVDPPADGSHRARLLSVVGDAIEAIISREDVFRVAKDTGCLIGRL